MEICMRRMVRLSLLGLVCGFAGACAVVEDAPKDEVSVGAAGDDVSSVTFALTSVPAGVHCVRVDSVSGAKMQQQEIGVTPGHSATIMFSGLPPGPCTLSVEAFTQSCSGVSGPTLPAWVSDAVMANLSAGENTDVNFVLRPAAGVNGSLDFVSLKLAPAGAAFGAVDVGTTSPTAAFTVKNIGKTTSAITVAIVGPDMSSFGSAGACPSLAAGATCTIQTSFHPTSAGAKTAQLSITGSPGGTVSAMLSGLGITTAHLTINPPTALFHGFGMDTVTFMVTNVGAAPVDVLFPLLSGIDAPQFMVTQPCQPPVLAPGGSCSLMVKYRSQFFPGMDQHATLTVSGSMGGSVSAELTGTFGP
jgi:hypothetical protein